MNQYLEPDNMSEELHELHERAEHAREHPDLAPITLTMAVLAVLVATVSLLGHRTHTEEIILQNKVTDQWGYYQAKNIRRHTDELFADLTTVMATKDAEAAAKLQEKYSAEATATKTTRKSWTAKAHESRAKPSTPPAKPTASIWAKSFWRLPWSSPRSRCSPAAEYSGTSACCWRPQELLVAARPGWCARSRASPRKAEKIGRFGDSAWQGPP
jgi:hypothetical protein